MLLSQITINGDENIETIDGDTHLKFKNFDIIKQYFNA